MAPTLSSLSIATVPQTASWCFLLLEYLDEFAMLAWYLVADGKLVEDTFARTIAKLDRTTFEGSMPAMTYSQARSVLIAEAITVVSNARKEGYEDRLCQLHSTGSLPDLRRLAFILRLIIHSSETEVAKFLDVSPSEVNGLVLDEIDRLSSVSPLSVSPISYEA